MSGRQPVAEHGMKLGFPFDIVQTDVVESGFGGSIMASKPGKGGWDG